MVLRLARHRIYVVIEMCKFFKRRNKKLLILILQVIDYVFGESFTVNKLYQLSHNGNC